MAILWIIAHGALSGAVNITAPVPIPNAEFMATLREESGTTIGTHIGLPALPWMLEIGALLMQTETELILKSRRVVPAVLTQSGFMFDFPEWRAAAKDLCSR